jgi:hypothetical protein
MSVIQGIFEIDKNHSGAIRAYRLRINLQYRRLEGHKDVREHLQEH